MPAGPQFRLSSRWLPRSAIFMQYNDVWVYRLRDFLNQIDLDALARRAGEIFQQASCLVSENFTKGSSAIVFEIVRNPLDIPFSLTLISAQAIESRDSVIARLMLPPSSYQSTSSEEGILNYVACLQFL